MNGFLAWLGVSIAMHAFPSIGDAKCMWQAVQAPGVPFLWRLAVLPIVGFIVIGALGSVLWLDLLWGLAVTVGLPAILVSTRAG